MAGWLVARWFALQVGWLLGDLRYRLVGCKVVCVTGWLVARWFALQVGWLLGGLRYRLVGC